MSHKRKHDELPQSESSEKKRHRPLQQGTGNHHAKHKKHPHSAEDAERATGINALKGRIRDLKRLLTHVDNVGNHKMSARSRIERERELEACEHELAEKVAAGREAEYRKKTIGRYHQVRFFDRQKATRFLKRLKRDLADEEDDALKAEIEAKIKNAEVDVKYATYYPLMKPYSCLYPKTKKAVGNNANRKEDEDEDNSNEPIDGPKGDIDMWIAVEKAMREDKLDALRNSKEYVPTAPVKKDKRETSKTALKNTDEKKKRKPINTNMQPANRRERRALERANAEDSDGGFFE